MLDVQEAEGRAAALVEAALKAGADAADVLYIGDASTSIQVTRPYSGDASQLALYLFFHDVHGWQSRPPT